MSNLPSSPLCLRHDLGDEIKHRYVVRQVLGAGAFGTVYRVEESRGAHIVVKACKEMHVLDNPDTQANERADALKMFQEEAFLLETLRNTHIPTAYFESAEGVWLACPQCGRTFKGTRNCPDHGNALQLVRERFYLIMDFIEGPDLEEMLLANGGRPLDETPILDWSLQLCDALEAVHAKGLSHRDIKPANIKIQSSTQQAMLIDFGLVKPATVVGGYGTVLKRDNAGMGTLGYAPESQAEQMNPDSRTDILAFGMTLYRLMTCLDPTDPNDLAKMRSGPPSRENLHLSPLLDAIIARAIQSDPANRYADVAQLRADLRAARYPVETRCAACGHLQRSAQPPSADTLCERCGRPLVAQNGATQFSMPGTSSPQTPQNAPSIAAAPVASASASAANASYLAKQTAPSNARVARAANQGIKPNPHQKRIDDLRIELAKPILTPPHPLDTRISELEARLAQANKPQNKSQLQCPACRDADLGAVSGQPTGRCPLCDKAVLQRRDWEASKCAVCREGKLVERQLRADEMFCAVCRSMPIEEESRKKFGGLAIDLRGACPQCDAEFDFVNGNRATLESYGVDTYHIGEQYGRQTLPIAQWKQLAQRGDHFCACDNCHAQWGVRDDGLLTLVMYFRDPFGIAASLGGQALSRDDWDRLAAGLTLETGNLNCPNCRGEWDYNRDAKTLRFLGGATEVPSWSEHWVASGQAISLQSWSCASVGKTSAQPGCLCPKCRTEFDSQDAGQPITQASNLKLVSTPPSSLTLSIGEVHTLLDWQRRAHSLPTVQEAAQIRHELAQLNARRHEERALSANTQARLRQGLEDELRQLLKQSVLAGYIPIKRLSPFAPNGQGAAPDADSPGYINMRDSGMRVPLHVDEVLRWESPARQCSVRIVKGKAQWSRDSEGTLLVTSERILFHARAQNQIWQRALSKLITVELERVQGVPVIVMAFGGEPPLGFETNDVQWDIVLDNRNYSLSFTPQELVNLIIQKQLSP